MRNITLTLLRVCAMHSIRIYLSGTTIQYNPIHIFLFPIKSPFGVLVNGNLKKEALIDNCETSRLRRVQKWFWSRRPCLMVDGVSNFLFIDYFFFKSKLLCKGPII
jgi:hypothetical protein